MAKTRTGLLLPLLIAGGLVAVFGINTVADQLGALFDDVTSPDPVITEDNGYQLLVGSGGEDMIRQCTARVALTTRNCGEVKVVVSEGDAYLVVISNPDRIASEPWAGQEVKVTTCLG